MMALEASGTVASCCPDMVVLLSVVLMHVCLAQWSNDVVMSSCKIGDGVTCSCPEEVRIVGLGVELKVRTEIQPCYRFRS